MPLIVDSSPGFDRDGVRLAARPDGAGLPARLLRTYYLRRSFRVVDEVGAEGTQWAVLAITGRIYRGVMNETSARDGRPASIVQAKLATNFGDLSPLDAISEQEGWWRLPTQPTREVWQLDGDPYQVLGRDAGLSHYEVALRRVDG
jgi:hypothetical protein